jgi:hypothetical protein
MHPSGFAGCACERFGGVVGAGTALPPGPDITVCEGHGVAPTSGRFNKPPRREPNFPVSEYFGTTGGGGGGGPTVKPNVPPWCPSM